MPGLNCYSCPGAIASCPIGAFQSWFSNANYKNSFIDKIPFYILGLVVLFGVIFGRLICGFLCPFGLIQELIYKIKTPKIQKNKLTEKLVYLKYIVLLVFVIFIPIVYFTTSFCKYICPAGTLEAGIFHIIMNESLRNLIGKLFTWKVVILVFIIGMSLFLYRFFCRFICPLGAFYSLFNKISVFGLKIDEDKCTNCGLCTKTCLMDVKKVGDKECIECGECINKCATKAIKYKFMKDE